MTFVDRIVTFRRLRFHNSAPELAHAFVVKRLGSAHEDVVTAMSSVQTKLTRHLLEITDDVIGLLFRRASGFLCCAFDVDAVFVGAGQKKGFDSALSFGARDRV